MGLTGAEAVYEEYKTASETAVYIGKCAYRALLEEVYTTPKPGLVDRYSSGAHKDMDIRTFEKSAEALYPWFIRIAAQGMHFQGSPENLFLEIRKTGMNAEKAMYEATGGVNTHKGLIFTLGIFCAAAGRLCGVEGKKFTLRDLCQMQQEMTNRILQEELKDIPKRSARSHGEQNLRKYGTAGIRGEALTGYSSVFWLALPVMERGIFEGRDWNLVKLQTLLVLMSRIQDSNILSRTNPEELKRVQNEIELFLETGGAYREDAVSCLEDLDAAYSLRNVSAGGCADLLAATIFFHLLLKTT